MSAFMSDVLKVLRGTVVAQVILVAAMPLLTRLFTPSDFGAVQAMQSVLTFLLVCSALRLEIAILSESDEEVGALAATAVVLCFLTSLLLLGAILVWEMFGGAGGTRLGKLVYLLPVSMLLAGLGLVLSYVVLRLKRFDAGAQAKVMQAGGYSAAAAAVGTLAPSPLGLGCADAVGRAAYVLACLRKSAIRNTIALGSLDLGKALAAMRRNRRLMCVSLPGALVNVLGASYTPMLLLLVFSATEAGHYALVERMIGGPIGMLAGAASQVFMAELGAAGRADSGRQQSQLRKLVASQFRVALVPALLLLALGQTVVPLVFGPDWALAGAYAQIMAPFFLASYVVGPVNMALTVAGFQTLQLAWDVGRLLAVGAVWWFSYAFGLSSTHALALHCGVAVLCMIAYLMIADRALAQPAAVEAKP